MARPEPCTAEGLGSDLGSAVRHAESRLAAMRTALDMISRGAGFSWQPPGLLQGRGGPNARPGRARAPRSAIHAFCHCLLILVRITYTSLVQSGRSVLALRSPSAVGPRARAGLKRRAVAARPRAARRSTRAVASRLPRRHVNGAGGAPTPAQASSTQWRREARKSHDACARVYRSSSSSSTLSAAPPRSPASPPRPVPNYVRARARVARSRRGSAAPTPVRAHILNRQSRNMSAGRIKRIYGE